MAKTTKAMSPGQRLLRHVVKANEFAQIAARQPDSAVGRITRKSYAGRSRDRKEKFASELLLCRESRGLTHDQLAALVQIPAATLAAFERGESFPSIEEATKLGWAVDTAGL